MPAPQTPYPADVLAPLAGGEGLRAHDHAAPHEGALPGAQAAAVFGADRHTGTARLVGICLFINLEVSNLSGGERRFLLLSSKHERNT